MFEVFEKKRYGIKFTTFLIMKQKTRFKNIGNIGIGLKKAMLIDHCFSSVQFDPTCIPTQPSMLHSSNVSFCTSLMKFFMSTLGKLVYDTNSFCLYLSDMCCKYC